MSAFLTRNPPFLPANASAASVAGARAHDPASAEHADLERLRRWFAVTRHDRSLGIFERNLDTGEATWDDRLCALSGLPPGTPANSFDDFLASVVPADREQVRERWTVSVRSLQPASQVYRMRRPDGAVRTLQADWIVQLDSMGHRIAAGTVRDVTERERTRRDAEIDRAQLLLAADIAQVGLIRHELSTGRFTLNAAARSIFGLDADAQVDLASLLGRLHPDDRVRAEQACSVPPPLGHTDELRCRLLGTEGRERHVVARRALAPAEGGAGLELLFALIDVTDGVEGEARERRLAESRAIALSLADIGVWEAVPTPRADGSLRWECTLDDRLLAMYGWGGRSARIGFEDWLDAIHPDDRVRMEALEAAAAQGDSRDRGVEFRFRRPDGTWRRLQSRWSVLRGADGAVCGLVGATHDVTERHELEERLRDERDLLVATQRLARVGTWRRHVATGRRYWSRQQFEIFGRDPAAGAPTDEELQRYFAPESWAQLAWRIDRDLDSSTQGEFLMHIRRDDGTRGVVRSWTERIDDEHGQPIEFRGSVQDITETERIREQVAAAHDRLQALFDRASHGVVLVDDQSRYVEANPAACAILGYTQAELQRRSLADLDVPDEGGGFEAVWRRCLDDGRQTGRAKLRHEDGRPIPIEYSAVAHIRPGLHLIVFSDISERLETEQQLERARERLRDLTLRQEAEFEAMRAELARDVHDELGQTLGALKHELEAVIGALSPDAAARLDLARTRRLLGTAVGQVRDIARALRSPVLDLGLGPSLRALAADLSLRGDVDVQVDLPAGAPAVERPVAEAVYRIAQEALTNAMRHADARTVVVALRQDGDTTVLEVTDDGCGFDPAGPAAASGLGLLGMRERAHQIGARLGLHSDFGKGTRVCLSAPLNKRRLP